MSKFSIDERKQLKSIIANLSIARLPDDEIAREIERQTGKSISLKQIYNVRQQIKKNSFNWYNNLREGKFDYIYEFKERINEVYWLQKKHYKLIESNKNNPSIQQASLNELHKLNITLANYFDVLPDIINANSISTTPEVKTTAAPTREPITV